jgi:ribonucleotide reductase beta subunit family protein with ferritin-like domain
MKTQQLTFAKDSEKYKIQTRTLWGWADMKFSEDDRNYEPEIFETEQEAVAEMQDMIESLEEAQELYRVVTADEVEDTDLYY